MAGKIVLGMTHNGKEIYTNSVRNRSILTVHFSGGGEMPEELAGAFAGLSSAQRAVEAYLERTKPKKSTRGIKSAQRKAKESGN